MPNKTKGPEANKDQGPRVNEKITSFKVRVINSAGENIGVIPTRDAIRMAEMEGLDLIEIVPNAEIPVVKIMDFGKYKYDLQKKAAEARKKQKTVDVKEIKLSAGIGEHDYAIKLKNARRFFEDGDKVKFSLRFKGREQSYSQIGMDLMNRAIADLEDIAKVEQKPSAEGRFIFMLLQKK